MNNEELEKEIDELKGVVAQLGSDLANTKKLLELYNNPVHCLVSARKLLEKRDGEEGNQTSFGISRILDQLEANNGVSKRD